jgi:transposase
MSLGPSEVGAIPEETKRIAQAAFPKGSQYMHMRDELGGLFEAADWKMVYSRLGQPGWSAWRLMLVTVMQFGEGLSDRQAADAVRGRIDWKYALGLELEDSGFDFSVLSEFRDRLIESQAEQYLFDLMLTRFKALGLLKGRGQQRTDSTHVLAAVRALNRTVLVGETLRAVLNQLAVVVPDWLRQRVPADWYERYGQRIDDWHLPKSEADRRAWAEGVGRDGQALLAWMDAQPDMAFLRQLPIVGTLQTVWQQQYHLDALTVRWRTADELCPAQERIASPYDVQARYAIKHETSWVGYRVHLTETCDADAPRLITHVETCPAPEQDINALPAIHAALAEQDLLPAQHMVDTAYLSAEILPQTQTEFGVDLVGPMHPDSSWQARAGGFVLSDFSIDWQAQLVTCPAGKLSTKWSHTHDRFGEPTLHIAFAAKDCLVCPLRTQCTRAPARHLSLRTQPLQEQLLAARQRQTTPEFKALYRQRAGIEGTHSQAVRAFELRRTRYIGLAKTHLQHVLTAIAMNLSRLAAWWNGDHPAKTRTSAFAALAI